MKRLAVASAVHSIDCVGELISHVGRCKARYGVSELVPCVIEFGLTMYQVILWSHPRSVSTAFERAFINRKDDVQCKSPGLEIGTMNLTLLAGFHEPFGEPFYYSDERMSARYTEEQCKA